MLTACGIETITEKILIGGQAFMLQQCLPLAVLKREYQNDPKAFSVQVATVLTACGIETSFSTAIVLNPLLL